MNRFSVFPFVITAVLGAGFSGDAQAQQPERGTVLITGANRGLGLELARQLDSQGYTVIGTARKPGRATELNELGVRVEQLDVTDPASIASLASTLDGVPIDLLINNAGFFDRSNRTLEEVDFEVMARTLDVNAMGPLRVTRALLPNLALAKGRTIVSVSSQMGSVTSNSGSYYSYRASKAALNQLMVTLAHELENDDYTCVVMHPGWVRTDMGGQNATLSPEESVRGMIQVIESLTTGDNGRFLDYSGEELPW
jgi:NAD(P)-dependent dehydrogenase (short-subunit alcohol dehydrogenase family)